MLQPRGDSASPMIDSSGAVAVFSSEQRSPACSDLVFDSRTTEEDAIHHLGAEVGVMPSV